MTFTSLPAEIDVRRFTSGAAKITPNNFTSSWAILNPDYFSSAWAIGYNTLTIPGGFLTWTARENGADSVHAARVHEYLSGSVRLDSGILDTQINQDDANIVASSAGLTSPFYFSPSVYMLDSGEAIFSAVSQGLALFVYGEERIDREDQIPESQYGPVTAVSGSSLNGNRSTSWYLDSGNLYFSEVEAEEVSSSSSSESSS